MRQHLEAERAFNLFTLEISIEMELRSCYEARDEREFFYHLTNYGRLCAERASIIPLPPTTSPPMPRATGAHVGADVDFGREVMA